MAGHEASSCSGVLGSVSVLPGLRAVITIYLSSHPSLGYKHTTWFSPPGATQISSVQDVFIRICPGLKLVIPTHQQITRMVSPRLTPNHLVIGSLDSRHSMYKLFPKLSATIMPWRHKKYHLSTIISFSACILKSFCENVPNNEEGKKRLLSNIIFTQWITADNRKSRKKRLFL